MGREWISPPGNLYASTIVRLTPADPPAPSLAFVAAVAVFDMLVTVAPDVGLQLKWPNDVLSNQGGKLCGMLLERIEDAVIIGIGINLVDCPKGLTRAVTSITALGGVAPEPQAAVELLAHHFAHRVSQWRTYGAQAIFRVWQERAHEIGTNLSVHLPDGEKISCCYQGLSGDGAVNLRLADGSIRAIHAGDVFLV